MRRLRNRDLFGEGEESALDMTPLIDVVFILLIFLLVTSSFRPETGLPVDRPQASTARSEAPESLRVAVGPGGETWVSGRAVDLGALRRLVEHHRAAHPTGGVVVVADRAAPAGVLVAVMDQARLGGVERVSLAAERGDP